MNRDDPISIPSNIPGASFAHPLLRFRSSRVQEPRSHATTAHRASGDYAFILRFDSQRIVVADYIETSAANMLGAVREHALEGIVAKRKEAFMKLDIALERGPSIA